MSEILCDSCGNQRNQLVSVSSNLMDGMTFRLCNSCREGKKGEQMEPRWLIVLAARSGTNVSHWTENRLYEGKEIDKEHLN